MRSELLLVRGTSVPRLAAISMRMGNDSATLALDEFVAAADVHAEVAHEDALSRISAWVAKCVTAVEQIQAAHDSMLAGSQEVFGSALSDYTFSRCCEADAVARQVWEIASRAVDRDFVEPQHVQVSHIELFLAEAFESKIPDDGGRRAEEWYLATLKQWSAEAVRLHFARTFGDVREAGIRQLRERVLQQLGSDERPENPLRLWCSLHEIDHSGRMRLSYLSKARESFDDVLRYIAHLATGAAPSEVEIGSVYGFNDGGSTWDRRTLFLRQYRPSPGIRWLRFTAQHRVEAELDSSIHARLCVQWDEAQAKERRR